MYVYTCVRMCEYARTCMRVGGFVRVCMYVCERVYVIVRGGVCVCVCLCVLVHVCAKGQVMPRINRSVQID